MEFIHIFTMMFQSRLLQICCTCMLVSEQVQTSLTELRPFDLLQKHLSVLPMFLLKFLVFNTMINISNNWMNYLAMFKKNEGEGWFWAISPFPRLYLKVLQVCTSVLQFQRQTLSRLLFPGCETCIYQNQRCLSFLCK